MADELLSRIEAARDFVHHTPVVLTREEIENNLSPEDKKDYEPAPTTTASPDQPILLFHKPANDNEKDKQQDIAPEPPDQAETAERRFYYGWPTPPLKEQVAAYRTWPKQHHRLNHTWLKTAPVHTPKPAQAATKPVASKFYLEDLMNHYQELNADAAFASQEPKKPASLWRGMLRAMYVEPKVATNEPEDAGVRPSTIKRFIHIAEFVATAA